jgi:Yip1 domain
MSTAAPPIPAAEPAPNAVGRIVGALVSPGETFASIARRPTWLAPLVLWIAASIAVTVVLMPRMDWEKMTRARMERGGQTVSDQQVQTAVEQGKKIGVPFSYGIAVLSPPVVALFTAVVIWGSFKAFGWDSTFKQAFGATTHAFLPGIVKAPLVAFLISRQESVDPRAIGDLLRSNLGFLVARDSSKALHSVLSSFDVFTLWSLALFVIGFAAAAKVKRGAAAGVILTLWLLAVAIAAAWNAIF